MLSEIEGHDVAGRVAFAATAQPLVNELTLLLSSLGNRQVSLADRPEMLRADVLIGILHEMIRKSPCDYAKELGPPVRLPSGNNLFPAFGYFRNAFQYAEKSIKYLRVDRVRQGDADWSKWLRDVSTLKSCLRNLADFLAQVEHDSVAHEVKQAVALPAPKQDIALSDGDRDILIWMLDNGVTSDFPISQQEIVLQVSKASGTKDVFSRLSQKSYIASKRNTGTWLTLLGIEKANQVKAAKASRQSVGK